MGKPDGDDLEGYVKPTEKITDEVISPTVEATADNCVDAPEAVFEVKTPTEETKSEE